MFVLFPFKILITNFSLIIICYRSDNYRCVFHNYTRNQGDNHGYVLIIFIKKKKNVSIIYKYIVLIIKSVLFLFRLCRCWGVLYTHSIPNRQLLPPFRIKDQYNSSWAMFAFETNKNFRVNLTGMQKTRSNLSRKKIITNKNKIV